MKDKLHRFIETVEEKRMKTIYDFFEQEIEKDDWDYTNEFKAELDRRYAGYINGSKVVSAEDVAAQTHALLNKIKTHLLDH